jgi:hypothetical protein
LTFKLPIDRSTMSDFFSWAALEKKLSPDSKNRTYRTLNAFTS